MKRTNKGKVVELSRSINRALELPDRTDIVKLVEQYIQAKAFETRAEAKRVELGNLIAAAIGAPAEGSETHAVGPFTVTVKQPVNRKIDWAAWDAVTAPADCPAPAATKRELDLKGLHWIQQNRPEFYRELSKAITATPGRVAIDVKESK